MTTRGAAGKTLLDAIGGTCMGCEAEGALCDRGDAGADVPAAGLTSEGAGITGGTCASVFSVEEGDGLLGDALEGAFASNGVEDGLCADEPGGSAFSDIAKGEI